CWLRLVLPGEDCIPDALTQVASRSRTTRGLARRAEEQTSGDDRPRGGAPDTDASAEAGDPAAIPYALETALRVRPPVARGLQAPEAFLHPAVVVQFT